MINYDSVIDQLQDADLVIDCGIVADGKIRRTKTTEDRERRGWYCLHEWTSGAGNCYIVGSYGVWHGTDNGAQQIQFSKEHQVSKEEQAAIRQRIKEDKKRAKSAEEAKHQRAARRAANVWRKALTRQPEGVAVDYLKRKGVESHGLRYTDSGALVIPMMDAQRNVHGLQFILPSHHERRKKTGRDKEYWPAGMAKQGHFYLIGSPVAGSICLVAEGYATCASLHQAIGLPVAVAFDANNLKPVAQAINKAYRGVRMLICADDDYLQKCRECGEKTDINRPVCSHCGKLHGKTNPGCEAASIAALDVGGKWLKPRFPGNREGAKLTDFNDLHHFPGGGLPMVAQQVETTLDGLGWRADASRGARQTEGSGDDGTMPSRLTVDEAAERYWGTYGLGGKVLFDEIERRIVHKDDAINLLPRHGWEDLKNHYAWRVAKDNEIGFDPTEKDPDIRCNLFAGWPTEPKRGECSKLLELLEYLCDGEGNYKEVYNWVLKWLAYPLKNRGAKMHSAIVVHGPQGTGKSLFFETYGKIYGPYSRILGQEALEDKFNADWSEKKLFILADEVLARQDMFHVKNRLKGFITGNEIRVNPKNLAAHTEKNHMNIVFLSNERQPLVLDNDDRRHCVIWVPPKPPDEFIMQVVDEIKNGGVSALHQYLLDLDLSGFNQASRPPMTSSKRDLIEQSTSSEERFIKEWRRLEIEGQDGYILPFCPCQGTHLYKAYERWCEQNGERKRRMQDLIGHCNKIHGWTAGKQQHTWNILNENDPNRKDISRKMVIPDEYAIEESKKHCQTGNQQLYRHQHHATRRDWLTTSFFAFMNAGGY